MYLHDDASVAVPLDSILLDPRLPDVYQYFHREYDTVDIAGVPWHRPRLLVEGFSEAGSEEHALVSTHYEQYAGGVCPVQQRELSVHGELLRLQQRADIAALSDSLHCLVSQEELRGTHANAGRDFHLAQRVQRNELGQVTAIAHYQGESELLVQQLEYDEQHRLRTITRPGQGSTELAYDEATSRLQAVTGPDGVRVAAAATDRRTGALTELVTERGDGVDYVASFRYDGFERLRASWDNVHGGSEQGPLQAYTYAYAGPQTPASVLVRARFDTQDQTSLSETATWLSPGGSLLAAAERIPEGWAIASLSRPQRSERETTGYWRAPFDTALQVHSLGYAELFQGATRLSVEGTTGLEQSFSAWQVVQQGIERTVTYDYALRDGNLEQAVYENGVLRERRLQDTGGRVLAYQDATGATYDFAYDALGRFVSVRQPDEADASVSYDGFGRAGTITWSSVGTIVHTYDPVSGLLERTTFFSPDGHEERNVAFAYDPAGRVCRQTFSQPSTGATQQVVTFYDGSNLPEPAGQKGFETGAQGPGFETRRAFNADGSLREETVVFPGWRSLSRSLTYDADGDLKTETLVVRDAAGAQLQRRGKVHQRDAVGRPAGLWVNDSKALALTYDSEGRLDRADLAAVPAAASDPSVAMSYDSVTHELVGYWQDGPAWSLGLQWTKNARGLIAEERFTYNGEAQWQRVYGYDERGFLVTSADPYQTASYSYDRAGLISSITDIGGSRSIVRRADAEGLSQHGYRFDAMGRVVQKPGHCDDAGSPLRLQYGPMGEVQTATCGNRKIELVYDGEGQRLAKKVDGHYTAAYVFGGVLTDEGFVEPVLIGGRAVALLGRDGLQPLAADARSTLLPTISASQERATPYGVRISRASVAWALDYAGRGYDEVLGTVRLGVRDYDPSLGQWLTGDLLFQMEPWRCTESPVECGLFVYALNSPLSFVDPTGETATEAIRDFFARGESRAEANAQYFIGNGAYVRGVIWLIEAAVNTVGKNLTPTDEEIVALGPLAPVVPAAARSFGWAAERTVGRLLGRLGVRTGEATARAAPNAAQKLLNPKSWSTAAFRSGQLDAHFAKHAGEWGAGNITKSSYLSRARSLLGSKPGGNILGHTRSNGDILRFNSRTGEFAVGTGDGTIRTLFRPKDGIDYWARQVGQ